MKHYFERGWRYRIVIGSVAFFTGLGLFLSVPYPTYAQGAPRTGVCYSVVTMESKGDLLVFANRYHTTIEEILKQNPLLPPYDGVNLTILEKNGAGLEISRGGKTSWNWPVTGIKSSDFGWRNGEFHHGLDIATSSGSLICAARAGRVIKTGWLGVYGLSILVDHGNGVQTLYAHNSKLLVQAGDFVEGGEGVSLSGNTGNSTGPHLHFEIRVNGKTVDPEDFLPKTGVPAESKYNLAENGMES